MAVYNPFSDFNPIFTKYQSLKPEEVEIEDFLGNKTDISSWADGVLSNGNIKVSPNIPEAKKEFDTSFMDKNAETHSEKTSNEDSINEGSVNEGPEYVSGTYASKRKGNKLLLVDTIDKINDPNISNIKGFLLDTAALESGFIHNITSKASTGSGWFGFLDSTKKQFAPGTTRAQFNNSPEIQVRAAARLYYTHLKTAQRLGMIDAAKKKGYTTDDVIHAMWLNPTWAKNFFLYGQEGGKDAFGTSIRKYLNKIHGRK